MGGTDEVRVVAASARGSAHRRTGMPNQDAVLWRSGTADGSGVTVAAVADGHGGPRSFRSADGARLAARCAIEVLRRHADDIDEATLQELTQRWTDAVRDDMAARPLRNEERVALATQTRSASVDDTLVAYGATLLAVVVSETAVHYVQLGDGDILAINHDGSVHRPLPPDERLFANRTTSLSQPDAWRDVRLVRASRADQPRLVLLCTDGYADSFVDEDAFLQAGTDYLTMVRRDGIHAVGARLEAWLVETTELGAGDDATLALMDLGSSEQSLPMVTGGRRTPSRARTSLVVTVVMLLLTTGLLVGRPLLTSESSADAAPETAHAAEPASGESGTWAITDGRQALILRNGEDTVATVPLPATAIDIVQIEGGVWALLDGGVAAGVRTRDPSALRTVTVPGEPSRIVADEDMVWLIDQQRNEIWGIDQDTGRLTVGERTDTPRRDRLRKRQSDVVLDLSDSPRPSVGPVSENGV